MRVPLLTGHVTLVTTRPHNPQQALRAGSGRSQPEHNAIADNVYGLRAAS